jgi:hypothetical protein
VLERHVVDQLLDQDRLAHAGAAEEPDLAAAHVGRDQVDHLDAGLEDLGRRRQRLEARRIAVDRPALGSLRRRRLVVDRIAEDVPDAAECRLADGDGDRLSRVDDVGAT